MKAIKIGFPCADIEAVNVSLLSDSDETGGQGTDTSVQVLESGRMDRTSHLGDQGSIHVGFMVDKVALGQVFF
jgi:hypothetical protein